MYQTCRVVHGMLWGARQSTGPKIFFFPFFFFFFFFFKGSVHVRTMFLGDLWTSSPPPRPHSLEQRVIWSRYFVTLQVQNHNKTLFQSKLIILKKIIIIIGDDVRESYIIIINIVILLYVIFYFVTFQVQNHNKASFQSKLIIFKKKYREK